MDRLPYKECETCRDWDGNINKCFMECGKPLDMIEDFRRYKDTKLTPEQMIEIDKTFHEQARELGEYKKLEEQGLLMKLPCKVGDTVYTLNTLKNKKIVLGQVEEIDAFFIALCMMENRFGKTVFLTKAEAEAKLKEMEGK